jgi:hypothetical protein
MQSCYHARMRTRTSTATYATIHRAEIKSVGKSGQISLGKRYAGKTFRVQQRPDGSLLLTAVALVPESQLWTLQEPHLGAIARGMRWAVATPPAETDLDDLMARAPAHPGSRRSRAGTADAAKE